MIEAILHVIYGPCVPFIGHPEVSYLMAMVFGILLAVSILRSGKSERGTQLGIVFAAVLWVIFGLLDQRYQGMNIRVDTFFLWPPVFVVSLVAPWFAIRSIVAGKPADRNPETRPDGPNIRATPHH